MMKLSTKCVEEQCSCRELSFINDFSFRWASLIPSYNLRFNCVYGVNYVSNDCSLGLIIWNFAPITNSGGLSVPLGIMTRVLEPYLCLHRKKIEKRSLRWFGRYNLLASLYLWILSENMNRVKLNGVHAVV